MEGEERVEERESRSFGAEEVWGGEMLVITG